MLIRPLKKDIYNPQFLAEQALFFDKCQDQSDKKQIKEEGRQEGIQEGKQEAMIEMKKILNQNNINIILNMHEKNFETDEISEITKIPKETIELVMIIADSSKIYIQYCNDYNCDPDYETFSNVIKNKFAGITQNDIDLITL